MKHIVERDNTVWELELFPSVFTYGTFISIYARIYPKPKWLFKYLAKEHVARIELNGSHMLKLETFLQEIGLIEPKIDNSIIDEIYTRILDIK